MGRNYPFTTKRGLRVLCDAIKLDLSNKQKPYVCLFCGTRFKTLQGGNNHLDNFHFEELNQKIRDEEINEAIGQ